MVNHILANRIRTVGETREPLMVRNLSGMDQIHGIHLIPSDGEFHSLPYSLASRFIGNENYEILGMWHPSGKTPRRGANVLRHTMACVPVAWDEIKEASDLKGMTLGRVWRDEVEKFEIEEWPSVGIVIPVFNSPELLKNCLDSLAKTEYAGDKIIWCVDNASTDKETKAVLKKHKNYSVLSTPHGFSAAVNKGVNAIDTKYIILFNQDCEVIDPEWLKNIIRWMELRPQCGVAGAKLLYPDGTLQHAGLDLPAGTCGVHRFLKGTPNIPDVNYYERTMGVTGAVYCIRRSAYDALGGMDEQYMFGCEDTDFCLRTQVKLGMEVWYVPSCTVRHIDNGVRKTNTQDSKRIKDWAHRSDVRFRKQWGAWVDRCDKGSISFVLPVNNATSGGCRVVWALANSFVQAGLEAVVYTYDGKEPEDTDFPIMFATKHINDLKEADILVATRFDTVAKTRYIPAKKKYYFVQQIETCMAKYCGASERDVLWSYAQKEYEIITIGEHLASALKGMGRDSTVLDVGFYRNLYPFVERTRPNHPLRVLMYASPADYKGGEDSPLIAEAIRAKMGDRVIIGSFHRDLPKPFWSDVHYAPKNSQECAEVYAKHDVYVYASHSDGFAMTPIEAMACGTRVVLTDFPGKDQYAEDGINCYIVPFRDFDAVAQCVNSICDGRISWRIGSLVCHQSTAPFDWAKVGPRYVKLIAGIEE